MSIQNFWENEGLKEPIKLKNPTSSTKWTTKSNSASSRSSSPSSGAGETIYNKYLDIVHSKSNIFSSEDKQAELLNRPFDFLDDEDFAFGINLLNNNVACVGENKTKLIQMAQEPWPDNVMLFQPYEVEQILLPDNASCLAVQAFLKMCNLPFEVEMRWNAEFMSPSGRVPFIKCGAFVVSELEPIVQFAANKGVSLCAKLSSEEKAEMRAYMSLITNVLVNAELYISWIDDDTYNAVTKVRNSSVYPWPLGWLQTRSKRNAVAKRLKALNWGNKTLEQVLADVDQCCNSLSQRLGERDYFFGTTPTTLDALVYGHIHALLSANGPKAALMIKPMTTSLLKHVLRVTSAIGMKLTPQEEYLLNQAFLFTRNRLSTERSASDRNTRIKRSRLYVRNPSKENITNKTVAKDDYGINYKLELIGFKPFASKQIVLTTTKEGAITCKYEDIKEKKNHSTTTFKIDEICKLVVGIMEEIIDKVEEVAFDNLSIKCDEKHDFEIVYPIEDKFANVVKQNELLDTIEENDSADATMYDIIDLAHVEKRNDDKNDTLNSVDEKNDEINDVTDSDGVVNDKHLEKAAVNNFVRDNVDSSDDDSRS